MQEVAISVADVRSKMRERTNMRRGAYFLQFRGLFKYLPVCCASHGTQRAIGVLMLCTITELDGAPPESGDRTQKDHRTFP